MIYWQKCPVCDGTGHVFSPYGTGGTTCNCCNGHGIINVINGLPPAGFKSFTGTTTTDFTINPMMNED
jgi:DnaJ-class molecular chaperone